MILKKKFGNVTVQSDGSVLWEESYNRETGYLSKERLTYGRRLPNGYVVVNVGGKQWYMHRLVWTVFMGEIPQGYEIDHINGSVADNDLNNLRCVTPKQNRSNPRTVEKYKQSNAGKGKHQLKPIEQLNQEGEVVKVFRCMADVKDSGFSPSAVSQCCRGILKTHQGYKWRKVS